MMLQNHRVDTAIPRLRLIIHSPPDRPNRKPATSSEYVLLAFPEVGTRRKAARTLIHPVYDAGKKIKGKKRHILVDTQRLLLHAVVHPADIQERDGGVMVLATLFGLYPFLKKLFADAGYQGPQFRDQVAKLMPQLSVEIVKRSDAAKGFQGRTSSGDRVCRADGHRFRGLCGSQWPSLCRR